VNCEALAFQYQRVSQCIRELRVELPERSPILATADRIAAHLALCDEVLARATSRLAEHWPVEADLSPATDAAAISGLTSSLSRAELLILMDLRADGLLRALESLRPERAALPVRVCFGRRVGSPVYDGWLAWRLVIDLRANTQVAALADLLERYLGYHATG
jgi:hypothetical protein